MDTDLCPKGHSTYVSDMRLSRCVARPHLHRVQHIYTSSHTLIQS